VANDFVLCPEGFNLNHAVRILALYVFAAATIGFAQDHPSAIPAGQLDPTRAIRQPELFSSSHTPLEEQYIWTREDSLVSGPRVTHYRTPGIHEKTEPHFFRADFDLASVPRVATLYVAGPRSVVVYVNGAPAEKVAADTLSPLGMHVFRTDVTKLLKPGHNLLAIEAVRGRAVPGFVNDPAAMQLIFGEVLVAKIVPAEGGVNAPALLSSGPQWKGALNASDGWEQPGYDDAAWPAVAALGSIEGSINFFQWNTDAGLYDWPGYEGASAFLAHVFLPAAEVEDIATGRSQFENLEALTSPDETAKEFAVRFGSTAPGEEFAPALTLDFGREVAGRVELISDADTETAVSIQYGESKGELDNGPYLGVNVLRIAPHQAAHGPKSAFRYVRIRFLSGADETRFKAIHLEDIYYPVQYEGSFESSDAQLNRIWETGAYTVHLCMQDDLWDAPKRDRGRWMGDTDISGRVSDAVFADHFLLKDTLSRLIGEAPVEQHVNGIPGYSSFWLTVLEDYERHSGDREFLDPRRPQILQLLELMDEEFDAESRFINRTHAWLFVDWAPGLNGDTPETRMGTAMEYYRGYLAGVDLLGQLGDSTDAEHFQQRAAALRKSVQATAWSAPDGDFGPRVQINAMAVLSGIADESQYDLIWKDVLSKVGEPTYRPDLITPYFGAYVLDAMARMGHRADALKWMRAYWGGMIDEGATTFWEAYDPSWPKSDPHVDLQADGRAGYFVSLSHGWSAGPTYWLMEQILGIRPVGEGFSETVIRPDLADLQWARGREPTPHGLLKVDLRDDGGMRAIIDVPEGVRATVLFPIAKGADHVLVNGAAKQGELAENGSRMAVALEGPGHFELRGQ
jgi:alpha-L-rhamnosidase